jgi:hypothetical protein
VWTIDPANVSISVRTPRSEQQQAKFAYELKKNQLKLQDQEAAMGVTFDRWGHMVFDVEQHSLVLKLITKHPSEKDRLPPLKIVLLSLAGENGGP